MIKNYYIELRKKNRHYSIACKSNIIQINDNNRITNTVHMDDSKDIYWIACLNLMRKKWTLVKAYDIPDFDISYIPILYKQPMLHTLANVNIQSKPCMLIESTHFYFYDFPSHKVWENEKTQAYFPKTILDEFKKIRQSVQFIEKDNTIILTPFSLKEYKYLQQFIYFQMAPSYNNIIQASISLSSYKHLWKYIRFFHIGDCDINIFLHKEHS